MDYTVFTRLYESLVQPILTYGSALWGLYEHKAIESVQNRACIFFTGASFNSANCATRGDMGWISCLNKQRTVAFRLWCNLVNLPNDRLPFIIHTWSMNFGGSWDGSLINLSKMTNICTIFYCLHLARFCHNETGKTQVVYYC